jgi:regulator of protease activity HflC (stomatin/prohibitin superfamily)
LSNREPSYVGWGVLGCVVLALTIGLGSWGCPNYKVWQQGLEGEAELRRAEENRKIKIEEARATQESAALLAQAEVERAKGVAEANEIIGASLRENEAYLRYLWIVGLQDGSSEVIYIPTEANLPLLEARDDR